MTRRVGEQHSDAQNVGDIMTRPPRTLDVTASVMDAATIMREGDFGDVVVLEEGRLCGILTDRDIVVRVLATGDDPSSVRVGDVCSRELVTVSEGDGIGDAVRLVRAKAVRRLPVLDDDGRLVGILSLGDLALARDPRSALGDISAATPNI
ncbi:MAG: CBS domain-containing protein [Candidatus Rokubacteria bacterium]|nr:CBS domain-containing protein [Candidatus Rokubacteria bacterium]